MRSRREIAAAASAASSRAARRRRFAQWALEMKQHPEDLTGAAKANIADALHEAGGYRVAEDSD